MALAVAFRGASSPRAITETVLWGTANRFSPLAKASDLRLLGQGISFTHISIPPKLFSAHLLIRTAVRHLDIVQVNRIFKFVAAGTERGLDFLKKRLLKLLFPEILGCAKLVISGKALCAVKE